MILDTHTLLWVDRNDSKLGAMARLQIEITWTCFSESLADKLQKNPPNEDQQVGDRNQLELKTT